MTARRDAIVYCGAAAVVWNPGFLAAAQDRGLAVIAVEDPAARYADDAALAGLPTVPAAPDAVGPVVDALSALAGEYHVRGVCALREDWVETAALLADWLGTPTIGLRAARVCRNKALQRAYLAEWSPRSATTVAGWSSFPAVIKPVDGSAGVGVRPIRGPADLAGLDDTGLLIEERVDGPEFSVESLVQGGEVVFAEVTGKRTNETSRDAFVELAHTVPAALPPARREVLLAVSGAVVRRLGVGDGVLHSEYRLDAAGRAVLMEVNARCPGGSIPALYHLATGVPLEHAIVGIALGEQVVYPSPVRAARQVYVSHQPGVLTDVTYPGVTPAWLASGDGRPEVAPRPPDDPPGLHAVMVIKPRGAALADLDDNRDRAVTFIIDAPAAEALDDFERTVADGLRVEIR